MRSACFFALFVLSACGAATNPANEAPTESRTESATANGSDSARENAEPAEPAALDEAAEEATEPVDAELAQLVATLDENPDMLHSDYTPSVHALSARGVPAARAVLPLLDAEDRFTRLHAQRVVEGVVNHAFGFRFGRGFPDQEMEEEARGWIVEWGYAYDGPREARQEAITRIAGSLDDLASIPW